MINSKKRFDSSIERVKNSHSLYLHLVNNKGFNHKVVSDILRGEYVNLVSSLDRLVHDLVLVGMINIYSGNRVETAAYRNFGLTISQFVLFKNSNTPEVELTKLIVNKHKYLAFQEPDKISSALSLIWNENHKWQALGIGMGIDMNSAKVELKNIIIRRNQIVHESDMDLFTGDLSTITEIDVKRSIDFIQKLGESIFTCVK